MEIHIEETVVDKLDKYANERIRPAELSLIVESAIRPWHAIAWKTWMRNKPMVMDFLNKNKAPPERKTTAVKIDDQIGREYIKKILAINKEHEVQINPVTLTSWLVWSYYRTKEFEKFSKYRPNMGRLRRF